MRLDRPTVWLHGSFKAPRHGRFVGEWPRL
jgi:hypothetical protein